MNAVIERVSRPLTWFRAADVVRPEDKVAAVEGVSLYFEILGEEPTEIDVELIVTL